MPLGRQVSKTASIPAPTGGLNARDAIADMSETDAVIMTNWFPTPSQVEVRNGYTNSVTGFPGWVETLAYYAAPTVNQLWAVSGGSIYNATTPGAAPAPAVTGLANSRFQHANISTSGGHFMYLVNGQNSAQLYNGTTWQSVTGVSTPIAITGVTTSLLIHVNLFQNRLWFTERDSMRCWYLPVQSIGGAAQSVDLSAVFKLGGYLMAMANWTIDNVSGINDYAVFISSEGEFAIYQGTDPASASTWGLVGVFRIGRPIGRRCFIKVGSDVLLVCADGVFPLSKALLTDRSQLNDAISNKITNLINSDVQAYANNFGWQPMLYPIGNKLIINVPTIENTAQYQYVMSTITGSWCKFTGWNAACWEFLNDGLYFGGNTVVCQADTGEDDNGSIISADVQQAFSYFKSPGELKQFTMVRPTFLTPGSLNAAIALNVDFESRTPTSTPTFSGNSGSPWNTSPWNTSPWGSNPVIVKKWETVGGIGFCGALRMLVNTKDLSVSWQATDFVYQPGGVL